MVNANIVISVSAILVAVILTIVFVMRKAGDPTTNFSVSVTGTIDGSDAAMYYCIGEKCQFYDFPVVADTFPGYYALVGFTMGDKTYVTEHSIGKTFEYTSGVLSNCMDAEKLDSATLASNVAGMTAANKGGDKGAYTSSRCTGATEAEKVCVDSSFVLATYSLNAHPETDSPSVMGHTIPSIAECNTIWTANNAAVQIAANATATVLVDFDEVVAGPGNVEGDAFKTGVVDLSSHRRLDENGNEQRMLWNMWAYNGQSQRWYMDASSAAYDGSWKPWQVQWTHCQTNTPFGGSAVARFIYSPDGNTMVIAFAGSNDVWDFILDLIQWGPYGPADLHFGFWSYVDMLQNCVNYLVNLLWGWGIDIDAVVGHSLGGAAAVVYKQLYGNNEGVQNAQVFTWGGPKTTRWNECRKNGQRNFNEKDPVTSNGMGLMGSFNHDVNRALRLYEGSYCNNNWCLCDWWGNCRCVCVGWGTSYNVHGVGCNHPTDGCTWVADCMWNVGRHSLSNYANYNQYTM